MNSVYKMLDRVARSAERHGDDQPSLAGFLGYAILAGLVVATTAKVPLSPFYASDRAADTVTSYRLGRKVLHETSLYQFYAGYVAAIQGVSRKIILFTMIVFAARFRLNR